VDETGPGSLKCVIGSSRTRALADVLLPALGEHVAARNIYHLHGETIIVHTDAETATIREWLTPLLHEDESLLVVEFERWSSQGAAVDRRWLLRRGH
jgi:hypothetical protein